MNMFERTALNSDHLRTFVTIAECRNLTRAAALLNLTQSAVSVQLRKLEEGLNATLFERHARGMTLTARGETLLPAARRTLAEFDRTAGLFADPLAGRIRVGIPDDFDETVLERVLATFSARNPGVEIVTASGCTASYPDAVRKGALDVAIASAPSPVGGEVLASEPTVWACADAMALTDDMPVPLALLDRSCWWRTVAQDALDTAGRRWRVVYTSESFHSVRAAVRAGLAVAPLPSGSLEAGMRALSDRDGFPPLPPAQRALLISPAALADAMADAFRQALTRAPH